MCTAWQQNRLARRGGDPLFPPALATERTFRVGLALQLVYWCGQASFYLFLALYLQGPRGQGRCITPLAAIVLAHAEPTQAGTVSGALSTAQQIGNCLGIAIIGVIFFGDGAGTAATFGWSLIALVTVSVLVVGLSSLLPHPTRASDHLPSSERAKETHA